MVSYRLQLSSLSMRTRSVTFVKIFIKLNLKGHEDDKDEIIKRNL